MLSANVYLWGYWLKHHCVCIYGENRLTRFEAFRPSRERVVAVNGNVLAILDGYAVMM